MSDYTTQTISELLQQEIRDALLNLDYGSVEIYVASGEVTQITRRQIKKTNGQK